MKLLCCLCIRDVLVSCNEIKIYGNLELNILYLICQHKDIHTFKLA